MANTLLYVDLIGKNVLARLVNSLGMVHTANRDFEGLFAPDKTYMIGDTVRIRQPVYFTATSGAALSVQNVQENQTNLAINSQYHVDVAFTSREESMFLQDPQTNVYQGAAQTLANTVDSALISAGNLNINRAVGTPGAGMTSFSTPNLGITENRKYGVVNSAYFALNPDAAGSLRSALYNSFNKAFNEDICQKAMLGSFGDHDMFEDQNITSHLTGSMAGTCLVDGASQQGSTINVKGLTASATNVFLPGDIISFASVYGVNPVSRLAVGSGTANLAKFVVQAAVNANGAGKAAVSIVPNIILSGPYQNVDSDPADGAAVTLFGLTTPGTPAHYVKNYCYAQDAFSLAVVPGPISAGAAYSKLFSDPETQISLRLNIVYSPDTDQDIMRFDLFFGVQAFGPYGTVVAS